MSDESYTFESARARLEEIVVQVRKKDLSLDKSLDLLEEGVRLANTCTELVDHTEWRTVVAEQSADENASGTDTTETLDATEATEATAAGGEGFAPDSRNDDAVGGAAAQAASESDEAPDEE